MGFNHNQIAIGWQHISNRSNEFGVQILKQRFQFDCWTIYWLNLINRDKLTQFKSTVHLIYPECPSQMHNPVCDRLISDSNHMPLYLPIRCDSKDCCAVGETIKHQPC